MVKSASGSSVGVALAEVEVELVGDGGVAVDERDARADFRIFCFWPAFTLEDVAADAAEVVVSRAWSPLFPTLVAMPSKVTSAFSLAQLRFAALNRARMTLSKSGMEKLACAPAMRRGIALPIVTLV
jgi:hypothetical protein